MLLYGAVMARHDPKIDRLASVPVFSGCSTKELEHIASFADEVTIEEGSVVITQGERLHHAYVIEQGTAAVTINAESAGTVGPGEVLGEISMFDPAPAAATVTATSQMNVLVLAFGAMEEAIRNNPDLAIALLRTMASRFRRFPA